MALHSTEMSPLSDLPGDPAPLPTPGKGGADLSWISPALTASEKTRNVGKTNVFFGPPLAILADGQKNTLEISGKLNRTAERYLEILKHHGLELSEPERKCLAHICSIGFMSPLEISELSFEVTLTTFEYDGLDKSALAKKLEQANFADLVAIVESLGF
jgi:hypothetical protein